MADADADSVADADADAYADDALLEVFEALHCPMVSLPPWPQRLKAQGRRTCFVSVYFYIWSKSQSINRVLMMMVPRLFECN